jgi:putative membrane protein
MQPPNTPDSAGATDAMGNASTGMGSQQAMDKDFVRKMIMGNHAEIDAGNLALQKSSNDDVKKFAQKMVTDHTAMLDDMTRLAEQLQIKAPQAASPKDKAEAAKMSALSGSAFDNAYVKAMVKDHKKDVSELKNESSNASIPPVKDAASKALPIVQSHLDMIEGIQKNMTSASGSASTK